MSIKPLPGDVVAQIKSSVVITSLNNVTCGLITNALDAEATKINVTVDFTRGNCSIEDNGNGIAPSEFKEDGGLGQLHYPHQDTSKYPPHPEIHGKHGVFLASVASLSLLSVTSHHQGFHSHNSMSIHNSRVLARHTPSLPDHRLLTFSHGTRVTVRDLFGSMPVRVKHRALQAEKSTFSRDWDRLLLNIVALLIAWPGSVSVTIREASSRQTVTLKTGSRPQSWISDSCHLLHKASLCDSPNASDWVAIGAASPNLTVSGYVCRKPVATKRVQFISLGIQPLSNEFRCNILYEEANKVFADSSFGTVEDESDSDTSQKPPKLDAIKIKELKARKGVDRWPMFFLKMSPTSTERSNPLEVEDVLDDRQANLALLTDLLKAMFYEFLQKNHCRPRKVNLSTEPNPRSYKDTNKPLKADGQAITASAKENRSGSIKSPTWGSTAEHTKKSVRLQPLGARPESPFGSWSKVKSGQPMQTFKESAPSRSRTQSASTTPSQGSRTITQGHDCTGRSISGPATEPSRSSLYDANGKLTRKPFEDIDLRGAANSSSTDFLDLENEARPSKSPKQSLQDETFQWINPVTKMVVNVNSRTGSAMEPKPMTLSRRASEDKSRGVTLGSKEPSAWISNLIKEWKNPVFELTEAPIPKLPDVTETLGLDHKTDGHHCHDGQAAFNADTYSGASATSMQGRLSKATLRRSQLIAQVDKKFILAKVPFNCARDDSDNATATPVPSSVLVLVDQHAADERCRVEGLMKSYFKPVKDTYGLQVWESVTEDLPKAVRFDLSAHDKDILGRFKQYFAYWGICYDIEVTMPVKTGGKSQTSKRSQNTKVSVTVRSLPPAILERCRTDPRLLAELIRKEAWRLHDEGVPLHQPVPKPVSKNETGCEVPVWVSLFHGCPPGIVNLINSRSCRSAIMFNDPLTLEQCTDLLDNLARCAFPFQCAHGRPSMVPVVDFGDRGMGRTGWSVEHGGSENHAESFGRAFRRWKEARP